MKKFCLGTDTSILNSKLQINITVIDTLLKLDQARTTIISIDR